MLSLYHITCKYSEQTVATNTCFSLYPCYLYLIAQTLDFDLVTLHLLNTVKCKLVITVCENGTDQDVVMQ